MMKNKERAEGCARECVEFVHATLLQDERIFQSTVIIWRHMTAAVAPYRAVLERALGEHDEVDGWPTATCPACEEANDLDLGFCQNADCWRYQGRKLMEEGR